MNIKTFADLQRIAGEWTKINFPENSNLGYRPFIGMVEEVGEIAHAHLKLEQGIRNDENHIDAIKDGIGDLMIYLCDYCTVNGYSLEECINIAASEVFRRNWKKYPTNGVSE